MKKIVSSIFLAFMGGVAALGGGYLYNSNHQTIGSESLAVASNNSQVRLTGYNGNSNALNTDFTLAAEKSINAVVHITTKSEGQVYNDPFAQLFGATPQSYVQEGSGSGVIISKDGYIVTNNHVINGAKEIDVILNDKRTYAAEVIGADPATDVALVKIKENDLPFLSYGNSDDIKIGEWVLAVGNPFNLESTVTAGIISAKARNNIIPDRKNPVESFLQTDAVVNPGNSGGALVNTNGDLIGINTAIVSNGGGSYVGYSFAVPVNIVKKVVADLAEFGTVQRAYIGVAIKDINAKFAKENNIKHLKGAYVTNLTAGGSAELAGIQPGDVITAIQDIPVNSVSELHGQIARYRPGDKINVNLLRNEKEMNIPVTLKSLENTTTLVKKTEVIKVNMEKLGIALAEVDNNELAKLKTSNGVKIAGLSANSKFAGAGIKEGFIITSINKRKVGSIKEAQNVLNEISGGVLVEGIYPNGTKAYYGFGL